MTEGTLAVTGASGFIGRRLVALALNRGWRVVALVRDPASLGMSNSNLHVVRWEAGVAVPVESLRSCRAVCHLAAFIPPDYRDPRYAGECFRVNALGAIEVARAATEAGVGRFVLFSSGQIYAPRGRPATEDDPIGISHHAAFYLASKIASEAFVDHFRVEKTLPVTVLRLGSVYGPGMRERGVVASFLAGALAGKPLDVRDGGIHTIDLVHVDDVVAAALNAVARQAGGTFNVGSGVLTSILELAEWIVALTGARTDLIKIYPRSAVAEVAGFAALDISRARSILDFVPLHPKDGLKTFMDMTTLRKV